MTEPGPPPGLHLAEDQGVGLPGDDVELALPAAPVAVEHPQADIGEGGGGDVFAEGAELQSRGHPPTVSPRRDAAPGSRESCGRGPPLWTGVRRTEAREGIVILVVGATGQVGSR